MEEQDQQVKSDDVEAHIRHTPRLQDEDLPTDEHGKRNLNDDDDDVEAHIRHTPRLQDEDEPTDEHGKRN